MAAEVEQPPEQSLEHVEAMDAVSSVLVSLAEERRIAYCHSCIRLVSSVENKYPLADTIMKK